MRGAFLAAFCGFSLFAQASPELFHRAPPAVDEALRARISKFYQFHVDGSAHALRQAEALVADDTKDFFYTSNKPKYMSFEIKSIEYSDDFTKAKAIIATKRVVMLPGLAGKPMDFLEPSHWKLVNGEWYWYVDQDELLNTPFGRRKPEDEAAGNGAPPAVPTPAEMEQKLKEVSGAGVVPDKFQVELQAEQESKAQFTIRNTLSGAVTLTLDTPRNPGYDAQLDQTNLAAGASATLTVSWKPGLRTAPKAVRMIVLVEPTNQRIPLRVEFKK